MMTSEDMHLIAYAVNGIRFQLSVLCMRRIFVQAPHIEAIAHCLRVSTPELTVKFADLNTLVVSRWSA